MPQYPGAIWMPVNEQWTFIGAQPNFAIIVHKTAGFTTAQQVAQYFQSGSDGNFVSVHYIVGQDGTIVQCVDEANGAGGNGVLTTGHDPIWDSPPVNGGNPNKFTISIEHVDPATDNSTPLTAVQQSASFALIKDIATRHNIDNYHIFGHLSIDPVNRARCPGNYPWSALWAYLSIIEGPNEYMQQAALDEWNSFYNFMGKTPPPFTTGIAASWKERLFNHGQHIGPPITGEYSSVDWNGNKIIVQQFADGRAEWNPKTNTCSWYSTNGAF